MRKAVGIAALWFLALLLVVIAIKGNEPLLARLRGTGQVVLAVMCLLAVGLLLARGAWRRGIASRLLVGAWCLPIVCVVIAQSALAARRAETLATEAAVARLLGRHFMVGYIDPEDAAELAGKGLIGGVYIARHNAAGRDAAELRAEIATLQARRASAGLPPLAVAADQEGGIVAHLSPTLPRPPALSTLATLSPEQRRRDAREFGRRQGEALNDVGVTLNLAPVLDLRPRWRRNHLDFNTQIGERAISDDPAIVAEIGTHYVGGLDAAGVHAAVKHFPGLGRVAADTHHFTAHLTTPQSELETSDWRPFREVLASSNAGLMVGHVTLDAIDPDRPASHSKRVLDGLIRKRWGFQGVIMTDDLVMGAIYGGDVCKAVVEALNGGADLLLVAYDGAQFHRVFGCAARALRRGELDLDMLRKSEARLQRWLVSRSSLIVGADASRDR